MLPSVDQRNRSGFGGAAGAEARAGVQEGLDRCRRILANASPITFPAVADAAEMILTASADRAAGLRAADRQAAVARLRELVRDERTPDALAVRAVRILLRATGRRAHQKGN